MPGDHGHFLNSFENNSTMKSLTFVFLFVLLVCSLPGQNSLSAADWQADLRFLQKTVHEDYSFLFKKTTAAEFDAAVNKLYEQIPKLQPHQIIIGIARLVASFQYGHTDVGLRGAPANFHRLPINLYHFPEGLYVQGVHKDYERALGAKVLKIEGVPAEEALAAIRAVVPVENEQFFKAHGPNELGVAEILHAQGVIKDLKTTLTFTLEKGGQTFDLPISAVKDLQVPRRYGLVQQQGDWLDVRDQGKTPLYLKNLDKIYYFEYLPEHKTLYVRQSQIQDDPQEAIPAFYERIFDFVERNDVDRLVLDVRLNGGGNNYKNKPIVTGVIRTEKINQIGKFFVIIGRRTFSACQNLVNELDNYTNALFIGEPTAENINFYGDNRRVELPNTGLPVYLSFAWWQDKPQWENADWTAPHLAVEMGFEDYRTNRDPVLEAVLNFSEDNFIRDPIAHLTALFEAGDLAAVTAEAKRMVADPLYRFVNFEGQFNRAGYNLLGSNRLQEALFVFQMNTELFPKSANTWDSLGEAYWRAGQRDQAIQYYNKAIELDPEGGVGDNARKMLARIKAGE